MSILLLLLLAPAALALAACGGGEPADEPAAPVAAPRPADQSAPGEAPLAALPPGTGELEMRVTDAPPEGVSAIVVTVSGIQAHKADAGDDEEGWITLFVATSTAGATSTEPRTFDLVQVTGVEQVLGTEVFAAGK